MQINGLPQSYGQLSWTNIELIPPQVNNKPMGVDQSGDLNKNLITLDSNTAKTYFINYVQGKCCFGKAPANECEIIKTIPTKALYVRISIKELKIKILSHSFIL